MSRTPREKSQLASERTAGLPRLTASGTARSLGISKRDPRLERRLDLAPLHADVRVRAVQDDADALGREREQLERLDREPDVLDRRHVEAAQEQELVRAVERRQHRPVEEGRGVDDDHVVALLGHLEQARELLLGDELGVLGPHRRGEDVEARRVPGRVAGELLRIQLARRGDQVVDRLVGLDPEHDRRVAELQVEVEQQRALAVVLRERGGEVRRHHGLAACRPWGRTRSRSGRRGRGAPARAGPRGGLADREDDVLGQLREQQDVGDVGVERGLEQGGGLARGEQDDRCLRVLADGRELVGGQLRAAGRVEDGAEVAAGECARAVGDGLGVADELDLAVPRERLVELVEGPRTTRSGRRGCARGRCCRSCPLIAGCSF